MRLPRAHQPGNLAAKCEPGSLQGNSCIPHQPGIQTVRILISGVTLSVIPLALLCAVQKRHGKGGEGISTHPKGCGSIFRGKEGQKHPPALLGCPQCCPAPLRAGFGRGCPVPQQQCPPTLLSQSHNSLFCSTIFSKREENTFGRQSREGRTCGHSHRWKVWVRDGESQHPQRTPAQPNLGVVCGIRDFVVKFPSQQRWDALHPVKPNYLLHSLLEFAASTRRKCETNEICPEPKKSNMTPQPVVPQPQNSHTHLDLEHQEEQKKKKTNFTLFYLPTAEATRVGRGHRASFQFV